MPNEWCLSCVPTRACARGDGTLPESFRKNLEQSEQGNAVSGAGGQVHRMTVIGEKSAGHPKILAASGRNKGPHVRIRSDVVHDAGVVCELGGSGWFAVSLDVA
jgi:hypothetical protein